jgi:Poly A polymerase head domain
MKIITNNSTDLSILKPIPLEWETLRRKVASQAGRHAIIAGGAIRDHILGLPAKDIDIFVLGMSAQAAKQIFGADIIEYAGVEEATHQYRTRDGLTVDLVFSRYDNVQEVLENFDLGICRAGWDGWDYVVTDDFEFDRRNLTITTFYPSPSGHRDRVLAKLRPIGFQLAETVQSSRYVAHVRELAARQGYRLMHRRNDQYWLMRDQPMSLEEIARVLQ